tara:strand:+ start:9563 stop:10285 length:723 start_codon:yes stop_codon:yes gene_type:complete
MPDVEALKREAGIAACKYVRNGMKIGLGTGSTVRHTIMEIGRMMAEDGLEIVGIPTSEATRDLAESLKIPLLKISEVKSLDLTIDGADEFDGDFSLIKGGGGALTREKIVANLSKSMIVVADETKRVKVLGSFKLPIEADPNHAEGVVREISDFCPGEVMIRPSMKTNDPNGEPYITDNRGYIVDCEFGPTISNPRELEQAISEIKGVVEVGLFVGICDAVIMASSSGVEILVNPNGRLS